MTNRVKSFNIAERDRTIEELFAKVMETIDGPTYTSKDIANNGFWELSEKYNTTPEQALAARTGEYPGKIEDFIKNPLNYDNGFIEDKIINNIQHLSVLYTILVERGIIQHNAPQRVTMAKSPLERCSDCGVPPDKEGKIYHTPECKVYKVMVPD